MVVNNDDVTTGVRVTHQMLFNTDQVIEVFVIGVGGVGGALLEQLKRQQSRLRVNISIYAFVVLPTPKRC